MDWHLTLWATESQLLLGVTESLPLLGITDAATSTAENAHWTAIGSVIIAVLGAAVAAYGAFRKEKRIDDSEATKQYKSIITRLEKQIARQHTLIEGYDVTIQETKDEHADCRVRLVELYGWLVRFRDWMVRQADICRHLGHDPGPLPEMPEHPMEESRHTAERRAFRTRTAAQGAELVNEVDKRILVDGDKDPTKKRPSETRHEDPRGG